MKWNETAFNVMLTAIALFFTSAFLRVSLDTAMVFWAWVH